MVASIQAMPSKWLSENGAGVFESVKFQINPIGACRCKPMLIGIAMPFNARRGRRKLTWRATRNLYAREKAEAAKVLR
jgi:hypothetical protein